jgi:hypothetical protein
VDVSSDLLYEAFSIIPRKMTSMEKADKNIRLEVSNDSIARFLRNIPRY